MSPDQDGKPDVDALVEELQADVEDRRRTGQYPPGLEEDLAAHLRRLLDRRLEPPRTVDLRGPLARVEEALPLRRDRIPLGSQRPSGAMLHKAVAKLMARQTQGILEQVQAFADPVELALDALTTAVEDLTREIREELSAQLAAVIERQAANERAPDLAHPTRELAHQELLDCYGEAADRLAGCSPVLDVASGREEFVRYLTERGLDARSAAPEEVAEVLARLDDASLGGMLLIQVADRMPAQHVVDVVDLASRKLASGGRVLIRTAYPQHEPPAPPRPSHPAWLMFLFQEAGFAAVETEWRPGPESPRERLHQVRFTAQDHLLVATR